MSPGALRSTARAGPRLRAPESLVAALLPRAFCPGQHGCGGGAAGVPVPYAYRDPTGPRTFRYRHSFTSTVHWYVTYRTYFIPTGLPAT